MDEEILEELYSIVSGDYYTEISLNDLVTFSSDFRSITIPADWALDLDLLPNSCQLTLNPARKSK